MLLKKFSSRCPSAAVYAFHCAFSPVALPCNRQASRTHERVLFSQIIQLLAQSHASFLPCRTFDGSGVYAAGTFRSRLRCRVLLAGGLRVVSFDPAPVLTPLPLQSLLVFSPYQSHERCSLVLVKRFLICCILNRPPTSTHSAIRLSIRHVP